MDRSNISVTLSFSSLSTQITLSLRSKIALRSSLVRSGPSVGERSSGSRPWGLLQGAGRTVWVELWGSVEGTGIVMSTV